MELNPHYLQQVGSKTSLFYRRKVGLMLVLVKPISISHFQAKI